MDRVKEADTFRAVKARVLARSGISMLDVRELFTIAEEAPRIVNISTDPSLSGMHTVCVLLCTRIPAMLIISTRILICVRME